ncbi:hypothetical protein F3Y22_tig00111160pilonHSYRG00030 [Hibiscus syriacus]|uniref:Uncharacterized protein n=1 Tax=Hibiscus syriacus TaxID=106335 RepID=A0A6A2YWZ1_HIBSY|nr:hypothetical protein F3Y22_tig00111160pilonHSYRG00030 [Hibiscus syriacus]
MSGAKFEVAKFDGQGNFGLWQTRVKDLLAQQGILKALRPTKPASMDEEDWEELQQRAAGTIRLCLADEVMYHVMHLSSPDEIWRKLESQFMSKSLTTKLYLKQRLYGLKMQDDHDLAQHVNVFNQIVSDLARLDVKIEDEDRAMILLCSLPSSYEHMVTTLTYGKETINVEEITAALLAHNQRKQNAGESSQADSLYVKGNRDRGRKPEKAGSGKRNSRSKSRDKKTIHCYKCKEAGHMKRDCPKLKKQTDEKRDGSSKSVNVVEDDTSDCSEGDMLSISTTQLTDAWILDSGCSYHITPNREWFSTYRPVNSGSVYLGDDRCCNIVGIGDVRIKMHDGSVRTLSGVRHIPDLKKNLISLGTLHKNGFIPKADEDRETIRIVKGALTVMKGKMTAGNIYRLLGSTVAGGVHSVESCDDTTKLWHMRLAHLSERGMAELHKRNLLHGVKSCKLDFCKYCVLGKQTKVRFKTAKHTTQGILDYVHSDVWGPSTTSSLGGSRYYVTFIDDFSRKVWVYFLKQKSEVFEKFKLWKAEVENQTGRKIKCLRSNNGTEYTDSQFLQFYKEHGIQRHFTVRKTPQQNGVAERMNRSLNERARCLRLNAGLPKHFWAEAVNMACYLINRSPRASLAGKVAEEVWTDHDVSFDNLRIFGCPAYVHVPADERSKLDAKSKECIFLGYKKGVKGFKFWDPVAKKVVISRDVVFDEQSMLQQKQDTTVVDFEQFPVEKPETSQPTSGGSTTDDLQDYSLARDKVRRTNIKPPNRLGFEDLVSFALTVSSDDPVTFHDAVTSQENDKWMAAMVEEMESLNHNRTWELVPLPEGKKPIGCKWVYKKKPAVTEKEGEKHTSIRAVLALVASWDLHLEQMDVKTAFLHGDLEEQIYMRQPEGFTQPGNEHLVCRLKKSLYGLKQSPRQWYKRFDSYMIKIGYNRCEYDCCVYVKSLDDGSFIFLLLYVDDMLIAAKNMDDVIGLKTLLSQEFDMKDLGAAKKILGMEICRDRDSRKLRLSQRGYVEKMLERFAMSSAKPVSTPLANHFKLSSEQCPKTDKEAENMAKVPYSNAVGCLMYAMVCTRPDLAHAVSQVCKYMSKPGKQHWDAVKWIFRYLKGTVGHGIVFGSQRDNPLVVGYVDSDYAGDLDNRRSTTGYVFTLGGGPICWKSTVQSVVALSTTEVEYMAAAEAAKEALWLTGLVKELGVQQGGVQLLCDNQSAIHLAKNQVYRARTKHIDVRFHKIRELVASGEVLFQKKQGNPTHIEVSKGQDIRQGGDLLCMAHKKSRCGVTNYVGWGCGGAAPALPIIGNIHQLGKLPHRFLRDLARRYGSLLLLQLGHNPTLGVSSADMDKEIVKNHDVAFSGRPRTTAANILLYGCKDVGSRRTKKKLKSPLINCRDSFDGEPVNLSELLMVVSNNLVSRSALSQKFEDDDEGKNKFGLLARRLMILITDCCVGDMFPYLKCIDVLRGFTSSLKQVNKEMDTFFYQIIEEHGSLKNNGEKDLLSIILKLQEDGLLDMDLTPDNIKAIMLDMLVGGTDTTSTTLEWVMAELIKNPNGMEKLQKEIRDVVGNKSKIDMKDINQMDYLRFFFNVWAIQRDPELWDKPEESIPERFEKSSADFKGQDFEYFPIGFGRRGCSGLAFAVAFILYLVANLLYWFDWELSDGENAENLDMGEVYGLTVCKKVPLRVLPIFTKPN